MVLEVPELWRPGMAISEEQKKGINTFKCPTCLSVRRGPWGEIACTGPGEALDVHPMIPMRITNQ